MNTQLTPKENFMSIINTREMMSRMTAACGSQEAGRQFLASMLDLYEGDSYLQGCDPHKVAMECIKAASLNLPLIKSLGYAYVVPFKGQPTFIIGYKGLIQLALRSGQYRRLNADCIYEGEEIVTDRLSGQIAIAGTPASQKATGYFAYFQLVNGFEKTLYMTVQAIREFAQKRSPAYKNGPWQTDFDAMAKKTVLRQLLKYGPMSTEMQEAEAYEVQQEIETMNDRVAAQANDTVIDMPMNTIPQQNAAPQQPAPQMQPGF